MKITDNIEFTPGLPLSQQSAEFQQWYNENIHSQITDKTTPDALDEYDRPVSFTLEASGLTVRVYWLYIFESQSSWACRDFKIEIL